MQPADVVALGESRLCRDAPELPNTQDQTPTVGLPTLALATEEIDESRIDQT
jgi:hypothetical protein